MKNQELSIDIETYSSIDIKSSGLYKYIQSSDFEILLFAYAFDDEPVQIIDFSKGEKLNKELKSALSDPCIIKTAYNATFEYYALNKFFNSPINQWRCTMVQGLYCGYPSGLDLVSKVMGFDEDKKKLAAGKALIKKFCKPCTPTKSNDYRTRTYYYHEPEQWELFKEYCKQDVVVEREIKRKLSKYQLPEFEQKLWLVDQKINEYGVKVDMELVNGAIEIDKKVTNNLTKEAIQLTGLNNPNSSTQLKSWIEVQTGEQIESLTKETVPQMLKAFEDETVKRVLKIRQEMSKTSIKKYISMKNCICEDGRIRGLLQFYGTKTGRWAGRLVQVQNLPRNYIPTLDIARRYIKNEDIEALKILYGNIPDTISQLIRTAFIADKDKIFIVADFSAIEARVISWLANEEWRLEVFKTHGKIYEASAAQMFNVPLEKIKKGNPEYELRAKGKVAELALGYQGSVGALIQMGGLKMGLAEDELKDIVSKWRKANKKIVKFWRDVEECSMNCIKHGTSYEMQKGIKFIKSEKNLIIELPSGRQLFYIEPIIKNEYSNFMESEKIYFKGLNQTTKKWEYIPTYGGKLVENIVQAVARDCLAAAIMNLDSAGYDICFHIHDEIVAEIPTNDKSKNLEEAIKLMCKVPKWAEGLPLNADGFAGEYYKKE